MFESPIIAAPMAGGTTTTELALATQRAGAFAFAAGGYKSASQLAADLGPLRAVGTGFGVNVFVPRSGPLTTADATALAAYRNELWATAARLGADVPVAPAPEDPRARDFWEEKIELLLREPVPVVSFTFGLAPVDVVAALQAVGTNVLASVTSVAEAVAAAATGVDALVVQHRSAGGHSAAFLPATASVRAATLPGLIAEVRAAANLPLVGAGGVSTPAQARAALEAGAVAVALGTALIRTDESGARQLHKDALADPAYAQTRMTRAFTGKPARALVNDFVREHSATAPDAYPEVHFLTAPLRAAAASHGDAQALNLWAGTGWKAAQDGPAAHVIEGFLRGL